MTSQIISQRLGASVKTDGVNVETGNSRFFAKSVDRFMKSLTINGDTTLGDESESDLRTLEAQEKKVSDNDAKVKDVLASATVTNETKYSASGFTAIITTTYTDASGKLIKKESTTSMNPDKTSTSYGTSAAAKVVKDAETESKDIKKNIVATQESNLSTNIDKLDIVPNPDVVGSIENILKDEFVTGESEKDIAKFEKNFKIYTFKDTNLLDIIKNNSLLGKNTGRLSQPLPIKYSFTILGTSGIRRGDMFNIIGIPEKYRKHGLFQVNAVEHSIEGMKWETTIEGLYRQTQ
jgi:hypothetical protein